MAQSEIKNLCDDLNKYLMQRFGYNTAPAACNDQTVYAMTDDLVLYMRYKPIRGIWSTDTLAIVRIRFKAERNGHGTDLLNFFAQKAKHFGIKKIGIETANKNASQFALRYNFKECFSDQPDYSRSWIIEVDDLIKALQLKSVAR